MPSQQPERKVDEIIKPFNLTLRQITPTGHPNLTIVTFPLSMGRLADVQCEIILDSMRWGPANNPLSAALKLPRCYGDGEINPEVRDILKELALQIALPGRIEVALPEEDVDKLVYKTFKRDDWEDISTIPPKSMFDCIRRPLNPRDISIRFHFYPSGKLPREQQMYVDNIA